MKCIIGHRVDYNGAGFLRGQRTSYTAKIDPKTLPPLIYQEIVPFQSEYKHSAIIWGIPLLNGFNGSVFLSELFGCHCFTNVCVVSFQTIWLFKWFWQAATLALGRPVGVLAPRGVTVVAAPGPLGHLASICDVGVNLILSYLFGIFRQAGSVRLLKAGLNVGLYKW